MRKLVKNRKKKKERKMTKMKRKCDRWRMVRRIKWESFEFSV